MDINFYRWKDTPKPTRAKIMARAQADIAGVQDGVAKIIADVQKRGDTALRDYSQKFDKIVPATFKVQEEEFARAEMALDEDLKKAIRKCADNVRKFHEEQMRRVEKDWMFEVEPGVWAGEQVSAIPSVGLYVPRGKGAFPSAMYMLALPAVIAGVENIVVVTPPRPDGFADDATLFTAQLCGVNNVYKVGGAQAIAALAYGTESIPKVAKVLGPGSPYVAAAKLLLSHVIDPGMPAGPSESIILCDADANVNNTCLDVLNEAEHGDDSAALLVTHDENLAKAVQQQLPEYIKALPELHREICAAVMGEGGYGGIVLTENLEDSIAFANEYAAEHLHLKVKNPDRAMKTLKHAGEILIGEYTPSSLGNYGIGINHVLPTGGRAHTYSCTTVWDFLKRTSISKVDAKGFNSLKESVITLATYENFPSHVEVLKKRSL